MKRRGRDEEEAKGEREMRKEREREKEESVVSKNRREEGGKGEFRKKRMGLKTNRWRTIERRWRKMEK